MWLAGREKPENQVETPEENVTTQINWPTFGNSLFGCNTIHKYLKSEAFIYVLFKKIFHLPKMCITYQKIFKCLVHIKKIKHLYLKPVSNQTRIAYLFPRRARLLLCLTTLQPRKNGTKYPVVVVGIIHELYMLLYRQLNWIDWSEWCIIFRAYPAPGPSWFGLVWEGCYGSIASLHAPVDSLKAFSLNFKLTVSTRRKGYVTIMDYRYMACLMCDLFECTLKWLQCN